ncbi:MAG TPA: hypothetical protein VF043_08215 [Ktedonobacteraceae bacterium]
MSQTQRAPRGETVQPPMGYDIIRVERRYFPVRLHLDDSERPGATAFTRSDGSVISFARRLSAIVYLYRRPHS